MHHPKYAMFFDMHTMKACPDVGRDFHADIFAENLKKTGVDLVGFHAKCNQGFCYFDTQTGIRHPALPPERDLFGEVVRECARRGIKVSAYFNCGLSNEDAVRHPEWNRVGMAGNLLHPEIYELGWVSPYIRTMCPNSPWRDHLMKLIDEVREKYPVAGFLFDSFNVFPCVCPRCKAGMRKAGLDSSKEEDVMKFAQTSILKLAEDISAMLRPKENGFLTYFLGVSAADNARIGSYLECECLPNNPVWGYDYLPIFSRYCRNLADVPVLNMTGRFNSWGDFGSLRTEEALEYDLLFGLANGMRPNVGDHLPPRGDFAPCIFDRVGKVFRKVHTFDPWFDGAQNLTDLAVVSPGNVSKTPVLTGAVRMLSELRMQFDIVDEHCDWEKYDLLFLPDEVLLDDNIASRIRRHLDAGKKIVATGISGLNAEKTAFLFEKEWGCRYRGECGCDPTFFRLTGNFAHEVPDMPLAVYTTGSKVEALPHAEVAGEVVSSYYNRHWDGEYSFFYTPPALSTDIPFLLLTDQCAYCSFPLCQGYYNQTSPDLRKVLELMLKRFLPEPLLRADRRFPTFARAFVTQKASCRITHLLNYQPDLRGKNFMIEDALPIGGAEISLRLDGRTPEKVFLAPGKTEIPFSVSNGRMEFTVPESFGYAMIVAEMSR